MDKKKTEMDMGNKMLITHAPHIWRGFSISRIMYIVVIALLFPTAGAIYYFGYYSIILIAVCITTTVLTEYLIKKLRRKRFVMDGSAVITGLLFALILPPRLPIWMTIIGAAFSIAIAKEAFGGLGYNIFNPALAGRAFLSVCFPKEMTTWVLPTYFKMDAVTGPSPLSENFVGQMDKLELYKDLAFGNISGSMGETSAILILIGGIILLIFKIIDWRIPLFYLGIVALGSFMVGEDIIFQLLAGGLMIGALFMATDYATSPVTGNGRIIFAIGVGILTLLFRNYGPMPEGVCFSILIMNAFTPLIDKYIKPKPFGYQGKRKMLERLKSKRLYSIVFLTLIVLISVSLLLWINSFTSVVVEAQNDIRIKNVLEAIFPELTDFEESGEVFVIYEGNSISGYTFVATGGGYGGPINMLVGIDADYTVVGVEILSHTETPGLGNKITEEFFTDQFIGLSIEDIALSRDGGKIDAITGATISSRAVASTIQERMTEIIEIISDQG